MIETDSVYKDKFLSANTDGALGLTLFQTRDGKDYGCDSQKQ